MYNVLIDLKTRLKIYLSRLRCNICYAPYSQRCPIYLCESGSEFEQTKSKFLVDSSPSANKYSPLSLMPHFPISLDAKSGRYLYYKSLAAMRLVAYPDKERSTRNVLSLEICCSRCNNVKELEIDLDDFLPKRYGKAGIEKSSGLYEEEEEYD